MKTHIFKITLGIAIGGFALIGMSKITADFVPVLTMVVGYTAVAILVALAAMDYRVGSKN